MHSHFRNVTEEIDQAIAKMVTQKLSHTEFRKVGTSTEDVHYVRINEVDVVSMATCPWNMSAKTLPWLPWLLALGVGTAIEMKKKLLSLRLWRVWCEL